MGVRSLKLRSHLTLPIRTGRSSGAWSSTGRRAAISGAFRPKSRMSIPLSAIDSFDSTGGGAPQVERYYFTYGRHLGANKHFAAGSATPGLRFAVWAPNAQSVEVVFGKTGERLHCR